MNGGVCGFVGLALDATGGVRASASEVEWLGIVSGMARCLCVPLFAGIVERNWAVVCWLVSKCHAIKSIAAITLVGPDRF